MFLQMDRLRMSRRSLQLLSLVVVQLFALRFLLWNKLVHSPGEHLNELQRGWRSCMGNEKILQTTSLLLTYLPIWYVETSSLLLGAAIQNTAMWFPFVMYLQTYLMDLTKLQCTSNFFGKQWWIQQLLTTTSLFFTCNVMILPLSSIERRQYGGSHYLYQPTKHGDNASSICCWSCMVIHNCVHHMVHESCSSPIHTNLDLLRDH